MDTVDASEIPTPRGPGAGVAKGAFYAGDWSFGWHASKGEPRSYVVKRPGYFRSRDESRFPLTPDGWKEAWLFFSSMDPKGARALTSRWRPSEDVGITAQPIASPEA